MPQGVDIIISLDGVKATEDWLKKMIVSAERRTALHARWAVLAMNWIGRNFKSNGGMVGGWKPLAASTLAAKSRGSGNILQDKGGLLGSFHPEWTSEYAKVGSPLTIAVYHEKGTGTYGVRGTPYPIVPKKPGGVLAFEMAKGGIGVKKVRMKSGRSISLPYAESGGVMFRKKVMHPGVAIRRMLPTENDETLMSELKQSAILYMKEKE